MAIDKLTPNAQQNLENIKFGLREASFDANFVKSNLDALNNEINSVGGDISRLGIKLDDLNHIHQKIDGKRLQLGKDFPVVQMEALAEKIKSVETAKTTIPEEQGNNLEAPKTPQENAKDAIIILINSARSQTDLGRAAKLIESYDDNFVVKADQGTPEKKLAMDTYNQLSTLLKHKKADLNKMEETLVRINSL